MKEYIMEVADNGMVTKVGQELVRCKDCKYHDAEDGKNFCDCGNRPDDWYCADRYPDEMG